MLAGYLKAPNQFQVRQVQLGKITEQEVVVHVKACGFCGHDKIMASYGAKDWEPFGHEFSGVVEQIGSQVTNVKVGDQVVIETSTFDPLSDFSRNGHPEWDTNGTNYMSMNHEAMGFAEKTIVPAVLCVPFTGISHEEACFTEPMGVAVDLILTANMQLGNDVVVMGCGAIGLMAMQMARASGARKIYAVDHAHNRKKAMLALECGADEVIFSDEVELESFPFLRGGVDRVLVTTPPKTIDLATKICNVGGIVAFLGISYGPDAVVSFDSNVVHLNKLQIRGSNAIPALYFPQCLDLIQSGMVQVDKLISHKFTIGDLQEGLEAFLNDHNGGVKAIMVNP